MIYLFCFILFSCVANTAFLVRLIVIETRYKRKKIVKNN